MVVTGGANGIGRALCLRFAKEGAKFVAVSDVDEANGKAVADEIEKGRAGFFACDVSQEAKCKIWLNQSTARLARWISSVRMRE